MQTQQQPLESVNPSSLQANLALEGTNPTNLPKLPPASEPEWQRISKQILAFFGQLPEYLSSFFKDYSQALITLSLIFAAIVTVKVTLGVLNAINDLPLLPPIFELIGIAYTTWFTFRYLIKAANRQELAQQFQFFKKEIVGE